MDHNDFDFYEDLTKPFFSFMIQVGIDLDPKSKSRIIDFPKEIFNPPSNIKDIESKYCK